MKNALLFIMVIVLIGGCSKSKQYTQDLTGTWIIYKVTRFNVDVTALLEDSIKNYSIMFNSGGTYLIRNALVVGTATDSLSETGTWQFQNYYESLALKDTAGHQTVYTVFDLNGENVQLTNNGQDNYMRKVPS